MNDLGSVRELIKYPSDWRVSEAMTQKSLPAMAKEELKDRQYLTKSSTYPPLSEYGSKRCETIGADIMLAIRREVLDRLDTRAGATMIALGIEGSANKVGVGIIKDGLVLSNVRETFITPAGTGFLPKETAKHHREKICSLVAIALKQANVELTHIDCICFTKGSQPFIAKLNFRPRNGATVDIPCSCRSYIIDYLGKASSSS